MKKYFVLSGMLAAAFIFSQCCGPKQATGNAEKPAAPKSTYSSDIASLVTANCSPCHIPSAGGKKKAYDNFANVKADIDDIIHRIELNPTDRGFMPFRKAEKLPDAVIAKFRQWKADGMLEN